MINPFADDNVSFGMGGGEGYVETFLQMRSDGGEYGSRWARVCRITVVALHCMHG